MGQEFVEGSAGVEPWRAAIGGVFIVIALFHHLATHGVSPNWSKLHLAGVGAGVVMVFWANMVAHAALEQGQARDLAARLEDHPEASVLMIVPDGRALMSATLYTLEKLGYVPATSLRSE